MKEDILEQLTEDYLQTCGYFTQTNIKFRPDENCTNYDPKLDSNHSDIDILAINPKEKGPKRVWAVSCKSWQAGFDINDILHSIENEKIRSGRDAWKPFRELVKLKWSHAFLSTITKLTGETEFTYVTAVTAIKGKRFKWEQYPLFQKNMHGNPIRLICLSEMLNVLLEKTRTTVASSQFGRTLQLLKAAGHNLALST